MEKLTELDKSFSPSYFVKDTDEPNIAIGKWIEFQEKCFRDVVSKYSVDFDIKYDSNFYDIFYPKGFGMTAPWRMSEQTILQHIHIFIHGGYWQECTRKTYGSIMNSFLESGIIVCMLGYSLASAEVPLSELVKEVQTAIKDISNRFPRAQLTISGHSAGAHLAAKAIENPKIGKLLKSAILICGVYDLVPLVETYIGRGISLTNEMAEEMSVESKKVAAYNGHLMIINAQHDCPSLIEQGQSFIGKLANEKRENLQIESFDEDHFSIISSMNDPNSDVSKCITKFLLSS